MTDGDGVVGLSAMMEDYFGELSVYITQFASYPLRNTFQEPRKQNIFDSLSAEPLKLVRDEQTQVFAHEAGEKGLQLVFPAVVTQEVDPLNPELMIDVIQREELTINLLDIQGTSEMVETTDDKTGELLIKEQYKVTKVVADVRYAGEKITALDASIQYDEMGDMTSIEIAWYLDPYIYTNTFTTSTTVDVAGNIIENTTMDIRIFGPQGCDVQLAFAGTNTTDTEKNETSTESFNFVLNNTTIEVSTEDFGGMIKDIKQYRETVPTATSTPQTDNYFVDGKIYHKGVYRAYLYPESDTWRV